MKLIQIIPIIICSVFLNYSCKKKGCTDPLATNFLENAEIDDGSCLYAVSTMDIQYGTDDDIQQMKLYLPANHDNTTKVIIMVHGGGWVFGYGENEKVTTFDGRWGWDILNPLLEQGYACAVMKYRIACYKQDPTTSTSMTKFNYNNMMEDIDLAIDYLKDNAATLNIANNHIQLLGESAGGHIVMSYALLENADESVKSAVSMFGPTALDDPEWKLNLFNKDAPYPDGADVVAPNYMKSYENSCALITNTKFNALIQLRSFGDHDTVKIEEENPYLQELSPATLDNIQKETPLFIMHGELDNLVPVSQATIMYDAYLSQFPETTIAETDEFSGTLKKKIYSSYGHGWTGSGNKTIIMNDIVSWMNAH